MAAVDLTAARLRELLAYDAETGVFIWLKPTGRRVRCGQRAGASSIIKGYSVIRIDNRTFKQHRLAWLWMTGSWPVEIDHIDGNRGNNRWSNLRDVARSINVQNLHDARADNKTKLLGASFHRREQRFRAQIQIAGVKRYLGSFETAEEAHAAYLAAKRMHHPGCTI